MGVDVVTFGCRLNVAESAVIRREADAGLGSAAGETVVVNTCAVTAEAVRQAKQAIRKIARERPAARIVVTGCAAQIEPQAFAAMPGVGRVVGNAEKLDTAAWQATRAAFAAPGSGTPGEATIAVNDIMAVRETAAHLLNGLEKRSRAFVQVQNGCDHRCTFCVIPYGRGHSRSVPMGVVVDEVRRLVSRGIKEVVLTGVDLTSYGGTLPGAPTLGLLVRQVLRHVPELARLRLSSIDSVEADAALIDAFAEEPRLMPHLHLSLQAGDDMVLKRMKRRHMRADAVAFCAQMRRLRPDIVFGADIITGFPTETEAMFARSLDLVDDCGLTHLHVFPYSPRPGTPAARMPQVGRAVVKERAARLRARGAAALVRHLDGEVGQRRQVLMEIGGSGRTKWFTPVRLPGVAPGTLCEVTIAGHDGRQLLAVA